MLVVGRVIEWRVIIVYVNVGSVECIIDYIYLVVVVFVFGVEGSIWVVLKFIEEKVIGLIFYFVGVVFCI